MTIERIHVTGMTWFDSTYGNTYHSAHAYANGELVAVAPFQYGYGAQYIESAYEAMIEAGVLPEKRHRNGRYTLRQICDELGIELSNSESSEYKRVVEAFGEVEVEVA